MMFQEQQFMRLLATVDEAIDGMNQNHPNIRARTMLFCSLVAALHAQPLLLNTDLGRLAAAVASVKVSLSPAISEEALQMAVNVACKGIMKGAVLFMDSLPQAGRAAAYSRGGEVLEAFLRQASLEFT